ncbi:MAG: hypothetical protein ACI9OJ_002425 [Myxococcota bacterium]|jgi:hypothetical protein
MKAKQLLTCLLAGVTLLAAPLTATADGLLVGESAFTPAQWSELTSAITTARQNTPRAFTTFDKLRADLRLLDAEKRGPFAPMTRYLRGLGPDGLMPMLEAIAVQALSVDGLPASAGIAFETGLLEAVGELGDSRATPVLQAVLKSRQITDYRRVTAATRGLGGVCDDASAQLLIGLASGAGAKRDPVLAGMGICRRADVAETLVGALQRGLDPSTVNTVFRALSDIGNSWVWQARKMNGEGVRSVVARGLVTSFAALDGHAQRQAEKAIMVVDYDGTPALIAVAIATTTGTVRADLERLNERFSRNPVRGR